MLFKIDENLPKESVAIFQDAGHDALTIHDQRMVGEPDAIVASVCQSEQRALVTLDSGAELVNTFSGNDME